MDFDIAFSSTKFDYAETGLSEETLNTESGWLPGVSARVTSRFDQWSVSPQFDYYAGEVDYLGATQVGVPLRSETDQTFRFWGIEIQRQFLDPRFRLYGVFGEMRWKRQILATSMTTELEEEYEWLSLEAGLVLALMHRASESIEWRLGAIKTNNGTIDVDLSIFGLDEVRLGLNNGKGWRSSLIYSKRWASDIFFTFGADYRQMTFPVGDAQTFSNGLQTFKIVEPQSKTRLFQFLLGVRLAF